MEIAAGGGCVATKGQQFWQLLGEIVSGFDDEVEALTTE
jgi:hypothetical protein